LPKPKPLARDAKAYLDALHIVLCEKGKKVRPFGSDGPEVVAVDREDVRSEFYRSRPADGEDERKIASARQKAFRRGEDEARDRRQITSYEVGGRFLIWLVKEDAQ
jgi:phytoene dehydrogenase-like protein